jgi:co-chaperonin GroES (HSP10)
MECSKCGNDVYDGRTNSNRGIFQIPFKCSECNSIKFDYSPVRDVLFIWPYPAPDKVGSILLIEDTNFRGGSLKEELRPNLAVVLAIGDGYFDSKKKEFVPTKDLRVGDVVYYNKRIPWRVELKNDDGDKFEVRMCGFNDVYGVKQ